MPPEDAFEGRVAVIIPAHNAAATLGHTLASLRGQTHEHWEAIVIDDGSTDATGALADAAGKEDDRIRVLHQQNRGEAGARNAGLAQATAPWILFLDADDWIAPTHLETMLRVLREDTSLDAVHCRWVRVTSDGRTVETPYRAPAGDMFAVWAHRSAFPVHACVVRRRLVDEVGRFDERLVRSADWDLWQRIARTGARFGFVDEVLAYYRMSPGAVSLEADTLFSDGMRVLRQGHAPDPRVPAPDPAHAQGLPEAHVARQAFYLLAWCGGIELGRGRDPRPLLAELDGMRFPELYAEAVAECLFDAVPLPHCRGPEAWEQLWPTVAAPTRAFLEALESHAAAPSLAERAFGELARRALRAAPGWQSALDVLEQRQGSLLADEQRRAEALRDERDALVVAIDHAREQQRALEVAMANLQEALHAARQDNARMATELGDQVRVAEQRADRLQYSPERRVGALLLGKLRLRAPLAAAHALARTAQQAAVLARLRIDRLTTPTDAPRVLATVCSEFPIYSQTFVHQEVAHLAEHGFAVRLGHSSTGPHSALGGRFEVLWEARRRLVQQRGMQRRHFAAYRRRMPDRVDRLLADLSAASGLGVEALSHHDNVLEGFTFARMAEVYGADWLQSYFFYDRSLMALIASELLDIPRGITCYADHLLQDYELKVVPLHLQRADLVVATSQRIRDELLALSPTTDPDKILVKPNGIDATRFPEARRGEPEAGKPHHLVTVCRIEPKKGLLELVDAVAMLRDRGLAVVAHLIGVADEWSAASREYEAALHRRIAEHDLAEVFRLEGRHGLEGVLRFLHAAHLFVAPFVETASGDKDGIPTALLEGMATGLPVVATEAGSIPEVVSHGRGGILVPQRDPQALAEAIADCLRDPAGRATMGRASAALVRERFDTASCEAPLHERIRSLIARRGSVAR